jgi:hypothetical protein
MAKYPTGWELLPEPMKQVLTLLGPTGTLHLDTNRLPTAGGSQLYEFHVTANYDVPPVTMTLEGVGMDLEAACGEITWQFLEKIGMHSD